MARLFSEPFDLKVAEKFVSYQKICSLKNPARSFRESEFVSLFMIYLRLVRRTHKRSPHLETSQKLKMKVLEGRMHSSVCSHFSKSQKLFSSGEWGQFLKKFSDYKDIIYLPELQVGYDNSSCKTHT